MHSGLRIMWALIPAINQNLNVSNVGRNSGSSRGPPMLSCMHCNYTTVHKSNFKAHLRKHTGERPFVCKICGIISGDLRDLPSSGIVSVPDMNRRSFFERADNWDFSNSSELKYPKVIYPCTYCSYSTPYQTNLKNHLRKHTGEKPFVAAKMSFNEQLPVIMKIKTATCSMFVCPYCDYTTPYKTTMKNHIRKHTGERPFVCNTCGKAFTRNRTLQDHVVSHILTKESIKCSICNAAFHTNGALAKHLLRHNKFSEEI
ncbi:zinc finger protein 227 [Nephila pilipes]|uniref:Zinc finger protein 227 n=1 Tax=Nephila pilipes TaxID=299642 RepID=A0A8X6MWM9_NEPPI|nr:zinc finger protein 227 [Nephila pilipes]